MLQRIDKTVEELLRIRWRLEEDVNLADLWECGDLVQLDPVNCRNRMLASMIMVVTDLRPWGVMGYVQMPGKDGEPGGLAFYRARFDECRWVGKCVWMSSSIGDEPPPGFAEVEEPAE